MQQATMDSRLNFLIFLLAISFISANASSSVASDVFIVQVDNKIQSQSNIGRNEKLCTLCQEYTSQAIYYLSENETQTEIISMLHQVCSQIRSLKQHCNALVDYYTQIFFLEVSTTTPKQLCAKLNLRGETALLNSPKCDDVCTLCHHIVVEILINLEDPDTQLEVIEVPLKGCNKMGNFAKQCKKLVFEYAPLFLTDQYRAVSWDKRCLHCYLSMQGQSRRFLGSTLAGN